MLALNVSIACESRGLLSCEVAIRGLLRKSPAHLKSLPQSSACNMGWGVKVSTFRDLVGCGGRV